MIYFRSVLVAVVVLCLLVFGSAAYAQSCSASADKTVNICSPANASTDASPVQFTAAARDNEHPVTGMVLYVDSVAKAKSATALLSASVALTAAKHAILIRAWDSTGIFFSSSETITVGAGGTPTPAVTISANPAQVSSGQMNTPARGNRF